MDQNYTEHKTIEKGIQLNVSGNLLIVSSCHSYRGINTGDCLGERGEVTKFSESSRARLRKYLRETRADYKVMVTVTYPADCGFNGVTSKEHLRRFLQELRRAGKRDPRHWSAFWFMEFQERGSIHYHILCTDFYDYKWIAHKWWAICGRISDDHLKAGTRIEKIRAGRNGIASYCAKYAEKFEQKLVPENFGWSGRFWGVQGYRERMSAATYIPSGFEGQKVVKNALQGIKTAIKGQKWPEISSKMKDLPEGILIYRMRNSADIEQIIKKVKIIEINLAISMGRDANFTDEIEELYDEMMGDTELMIEPKDIELCQSSVMQNRIEVNPGNILKRMLEESFAEWSERVGTERSYRKKSSNALNYVITSELEPLSLSYWKRRKLFQSP